MRVDRAALRRALVSAYPWLTATEVGPRAVDAGTCDRCGVLPRLLPTCGPSGWQAVCRDCAREVGPDGWCDGHAETGEGARRWADALPDEWSRVVTLWWIATGEVRIERPSDLDAQALPAPVRDRLRPAP